MSGLLNLFYSFLKVGLFSIGGGYATIPLIQEQVVNNHHWLSLSEFTDIITISQMTPGPLAVNTSTFVGLRTNGIIGAILATLGCVISGFVISILLYKFFSKNKENESINNVLKGLRASSVGLIAASVITISFIALFGSDKVGLNIKDLDLKVLLIFIGSLFALRKYKLNPMIIIILSGVAGLI